MADTTFTDYTTVITAAWLNDVNDLAYSSVEKDAGNWIAGLTQPNIAWIASGARFAVGATNGGIGITGFSRTSDSADSGTPAAIGLTGFAYNDDTYAKPAWGAYFEGKSASGSTGFTCGFEVDSVNNRSFLDANAYTNIGTNTAVDIGQWIAAGGDPSVNPTAADSTWGIGFVANGAKWGKGIVFKNGSLRVRSLGSYSTQIAMELAQNQSIDWVNPDGNRSGWLANKCGTGEKSLGLAFISGGLRFVDDADAVQFQVAKTGSATSYISATGSSSGFPTLAAINDGGGVVSMFYKSQSTGGHYFANGSGETQFAVYATAGATRFLTVTGSATNPTLATTAGNLNISNTQVNFASATATPAGGTTGVGITFGTTANLGIFYGSGAPTLSAAKGSFYIRTDGTTTTSRAYINTDGGTTWTAITTVA